MFGSFLSLVLISAAVQPAAGEKDPFEPAILVQAKAVRVEATPRGDMAKCTFKIEKVFSGDSRLKGMSFQETFTYELTGLNPNIDAELYPPMKEGEVGIWQLERSKEDGSLIPTLQNHGTHEDDGLVGWRLALPVPARRIIGGRYFSSFLGPHNYPIGYSSALQWARVVESVYNAKRPERLMMLRKYVYNDNPHVAAWSVYLLAEYNPKDLISFLKELAPNPKLSLGAQTAIDSVLCKRERKKWTACEERMALLQRWVSGEIIDTRDVLIIAARIKDALQHRVDEEGKAYRELDWKTWLPLMEKWVVEQHLYPAFEGRLFYIYRTVDHPLDPAGGVILSYALNLLKTSKDPERLRFAARWLREPILSNRELSDLRVLMGKMNNERAAALLKEAIEAREQRPPVTRPEKRPEKGR